MQRTAVPSARRFDEANHIENRPIKKEIYQKKKLQIKKSWHTEKPISQKKESSILSPNQKFKSRLTRNIKK